MNNDFRIAVLICLFLSNCFAMTLKSQEIIPVEELELIADTVAMEVADSIRFESADTTYFESVDSVTQAVMKAADSLVVLSEKEMRVVEPFKPNPTKAVIFSALVPGLGQIYNRKYWKLPILYGGLMGCAYAITWNNTNYSDYTDAYWAVMQKEDKDIWANKKLWESFVTGTVDTSNEEEMVAKAKDPNFQNNLKRNRDYFRRYRDLSIFIGIGVYVLGILDAYVDAHLFDFDISPDLSMRVEPAVTPGNGHSPNIYGINCSFKF